MDNDPYFTVVMGDLPEKKTIRFDSVSYMIRFSTANKLTFLLIT